MKCDKCGILLQRVVKFRFPGRLYPLLLSEENMKVVNPECIVDSAHGVYIPQTFAELYLDGTVFPHNVCYEDQAVLLDGPENEDYWDVWNDVLDYFEVKQSNSTVTIHQDMDLFAIIDGNYGELE